MSRVISSGPSLVSRASTSYFSMCRLVKTSSWTRRSEIRMASSKLPPSQNMKAPSTFCPRASSPPAVDRLSARACPAATRSPARTRGRCERQVPWLVRTKARSG